MSSHRCLSKMVLLLALFACFSRLSFGAEPKLFMAGTEMKLGMTEESLLPRLKEDYKLTSAGEHGWAIFEKNGPPHKMIGTIGFTGGRLSWISKDWGSYDGNVVLSFAKELFSLLSSLGENQPSPVIVHPRVTVRQPGLIISVIDLLYSERTISISIVESKEHGSSISMTEVLKVE